MPEAPRSAAPEALRGFWGRCTHTVFQKPRAQPEGVGIRSVQNLGSTSKPKNVPQVFWSTQTRVLGLSATRGGSNGDCTAKRTKRAKTLSFHRRESVRENARFPENTVEGKFIGVSVSSKAKKGTRKDRRNALRFLGVFIALDSLKSEV